MSFSEAAVNSISKMEKLADARTVLYLTVQRLYLIRNTREQKAELLDHLWGPRITTKTSIGSESTNSPTPTVAAPPAQLAGGIPRRGGGPGGE